MTDLKAGRLCGRAAIVTGGTTGLGFEIASTLLAQGADVAICGRDETALNSALSKLSGLATSGNRIVGFTCDVASSEHVNFFVQKTLDEFESIQILINNAGILGPMGRTESIGVDEWRQTLEINLFGTFYCCQAVVPHFRDNRYGKIINLSGGGATSPRPFFSAYAASKAAVVRLTENLAVELRDCGVDVNAVAPGALATRMLDQVLEAGADLIGQSQFTDAVRLQQGGCAPPERAADLCAYLASADSDGITGRLISAPWDPWEALHSNLTDLMSSDIYTLRRIVPEDRGRVWKE